MNFPNSHCRGTQRRSNPNRTTSLGASRQQTPTSSNPSTPPTPPHPPPTHPSPPKQQNTSDAEHCELSAKKPSRRGTGGGGGWGVERTTSSTNPTTPNPRQDTVQIWHPQLEATAAEREFSLHPFSVTNLFPATTV